MVSGVPMSINGASVSKTLILIPFRRKNGKTSYSKLRGFFEGKFLKILLKSLVKYTQFNRNAILNF